MRDRAFRPAGQPHPGHTRIYTDILATATLATDILATDILATDILATATLATDVLAIRSFRIIAH
jgi:hypothetical protein